MATVTYIKPKEGGRVSVGITDDGLDLRLNISASLYSSMSFVRGSTLTDDELATLTREDEEYRAMKKALSLLGYSDKNRRELYMRLVREGFSREVASAVVETCLGLGYIRERDQLERLILREANVNLRGPRYIRDKLAAKGYSRADIDAVTESLVDSGEIDFRENLLRLAEKRGADSPDELRALAYKYGFSTFD